MAYLSKRGGGNGGIQHHVQLHSLFGTGWLTFWQQGAGQKPKVGILKLGNWKKYEFRNCRKSEEVGNQKNKDIGQSSKSEKVEKKKEKIRN